MYNIVDREVRKKRLFSWKHRCCFPYVPAEAKMLSVKA